ncbi:Alanyl-tRNA synthetase [hydrothermal vent metagenome]|uniref:Alanine--tRNA ligase n=1 Tax=hydrothermal vent metagenome TaxID=652676 RepID=A0A3B1E6W7_9ZZZZ
MDIRIEFLNYFKQKGHDIVGSMSLVPNDPTLMFVNAGMVQFKDIFLGTLPIPKNPKITSCQLCLRAGGKHNDLENVGYTSRHHTLFEMLGNFSFGDYFKEDAIAHAWEFITKNLELPIEKLWVTIHNSDDEAYNIWTKHIDKNRIIKCGDKDNFWSMGDIGACGPCSEIFYDQGSEHFNSNEDKIGGEGDRFLEIWNLVFMQYDRQKDGALVPLPKPSIDTGMGLERITAIKEGVLNNFDSSTFKPMIEEIESLSQKATEKNIGSYRIIADHTRAVSFMLSDGILFDKVGRGYVMRRILRRAVRHGYLLGFRKPFMANIIDTLIKIVGEYYSFLEDKKDYIQEQITLEEKRFFKTIDKGMNLFNEELKKTKKQFNGEVAFKLYDTYGFPLDLTEDMLREKDMIVNNEIFDKCMNGQRTKAKAAWKGSGDIAKNGDFKLLLEKYGKNKFVGYDSTECKSKIVALLDDNFKQIETLENNSIGWIMLDKTPFYAESGGQIGSCGTLIKNNKISIIHNTKMFFGLNLSKIETKNYILNTNDIVELKDIQINEIAKHHSATHLLQSALKQMLGDTVTQAGSLNDDKRLRFDFTYPKAMSDNELNKVEDIVNKWIEQGIRGKVEELSIDEAKKTNAIAMFGEKYGKTVRVVSFGDISIEFCCGTHVKSTAQIGSFYITKESGVSAGVRRIEAVCGKSARTYIKNIIYKMIKLETEVKNKDLLLGIAKLKEQIKSLKTELKLKDIQNNNQNPLKEEMNGDIKIIIDIIKNEDIKNIIDKQKNKNDKLAIFLFQIKDNKVLMACGIKNIDLKAGDWIKAVAPIVSGNGGGRSDFAQAGGKDASKIQEAKAKAMKFLKENI